MTNEYDVLEEYKYNNNLLYINKIINDTKKKFTIYNILFSIGFFYIADCIGFSRHIINECKKNE